MSFASTIRNQGRYNGVIPYKYNGMMNLYLKYSNKNTNIRILQFETMKQLKNMECTQQKLLAILSYEQGDEL